MNQVLGHDGRPGHPPSKAVQNVFVPRVRCVEICASHSLHASSPQGPKRIRPRPKKDDTPHCRPGSGYEGSKPPISAMVIYRGRTCRGPRLKKWSGRRDSNPRRPAWEADRSAHRLYSRFPRVDHRQSDYIEVAHVARHDSKPVVQSGCRQQAVND